MGGIVSPTASGASGDGATADGAQPVLLTIHAKSSKVSERVCFTGVLIRVLGKRWLGDELESLLDCTGSMGADESRIGWGK